METGEYNLAPAKEVMTLVSGVLDVLLPGAGAQTFNQGQAFTVPANVKFKVKAQASRLPLHLRVSPRTSPSEQAALACSAFLPTGLYPQRRV